MHASHRVFLSLLVAAASAGAQAAIVLQTPLNANNGQRGIMFDVQTGSSALVFESFGVDLYAGTTADYEVYTVAGGITGNLTNPGAWTLRDTFSGVTGLAAGTLITLDITDFTVAANSTIGLYITNTSGGGVRYTDTPNVGNLLASDANLSIFSGVGKSYPFAGTFTARSFNGSITYSLANAQVPEPGTHALAGLGLLAAIWAGRRSGANPTRRQTRHAPSRRPA